MSETMQALGELVGAESASFRDVIKAIGDQAAYTSALESVFVTAGELFYKANPTVEDRAAFDGAMRAVEAMSRAPAAPWRG